MRLLAHAKLNLSLAVGSPRDDGYHDVDTLVQTIGLADGVTVTRRRSGLEVRNSVPIPQDEDLCLRAAAALLRAKHEARGARIEVDKRIPLGAGLGGGSSDAAATLWAIDRLYPPSLPEETLLALAGELGVDVPLFFTGGRLRAVGRGDRVVERLPTPDEWYVVLVPPFPCSTEAVYAAHRARRKEAPEERAPSGFGRNDLLAAAVSVFPELSRYVHAVRAPAARYGGLTGSGSACYAAVADEETAQGMAAALRKRFPEAEVMHTVAVPCGIERLESENACTSR
ncbi:MAG: 4-(cytidine 5'-diphospho)-2-C-methyl-D-erythritol kinase [Candidatus Bipolaricaulota bacterium]|nr:MAG: 4-(cytidine 5'-diphospho)-2-C-methyl-D-erythritol kinase [Candidatus Bipolaricaulota bacterium]